MRPALFLLLLMMATGLSGQERVSEATNELKLDLGAAIMGNLSLAWERPLDAGLAAEFGMRVFTKPLVLLGNDDKLSGFLVRAGMVRYPSARKGKENGLAGKGFYKRTDLFLMVRNGTFNVSDDYNYYSYPPKIVANHFSEMASGFTWNFGYKTRWSDRSCLDAYLGFGIAYIVSKNDVDYSASMYRYDSNMARWMGVSVLDMILSPASQFGFRYTYLLSKP